MRRMTAQLKPIPDLRASELLGFCKAMADQVRLNILSILDKESFGVLELCEILQLKQPALTHHLKLLTDAGLLTKRREGNSIFYSRNYHGAGNFANLQQTLFDELSTVSLSEEIAERKQRLQRKRAHLSEQFFQQHNEQFSANQELVAPITAYAEKLNTLLEERADDADLKSLKVLEVGPGEGEFLPYLAKLFEHVDALDNSDKMLDSARQYCDDKKINGISFISGDTSSDQLNEEFYDVVVVNMVLHHNPSPVELLQDIVRVMKSGGSLFISELTAHQQDWVRDACGDIWLGFKAEDLSVTAEIAGLQEGTSQYLAQRNGFVVQIREFIKP